MKKVGVLEITCHNTKLSFNMDVHLLHDKNISVKTPLDF